MNSVTKNDNLHNRVTYLLLYHVINNQTKTKNKQNKTKNKQKKKIISNLACSILLSVSVNCFSDGLTDLI